MAYDPRTFPLAPAEPALARAGRGRPRKPTDRMDGEGRRKLLFAPQPPWCEQVPQSTSLGRAVGSGEEPWHPSTKQGGATAPQHPHNQAATNLITFTVVLMRLEYFNINDYLIKLQLVISLARPGYGRGLCEELRAGWGVSEDSGACPPANPGHQALLWAVEQVLGQR